MLTLLIIVTGVALADSKRIVIYPTNRYYWDVKYGDTLGEIVDSLAPRNTYLQQQLMQSIVADNPDVFVGGDPNYMLANKRLRLRGEDTTQHSPGTNKNYTVRNFQWGSIKTYRHPEQ